MFAIVKNTFADNLQKLNNLTISSMRPNIKTLIFVAVGTELLFADVMFYHGPYKLHQKNVTELKKNEEVKAFLGKNIERVGWGFFPEAFQWRGDRHIGYRFQIKGENGNATVHTTNRKVNGHWKSATYVIEKNSGEKITVNQENLA